MGGHCCDWHIDKRQAMPRGKITGGSGILNYMMWVRGHREDWDVIFGVDGWAWDDVLPYFKSIESVHHHQQDDSDAARGYNGPVVVNEARNLMDKHSVFAQAAVDAFVETAKFEFLPNGQNSQSGSNVGVGYTEFNIDESGHRNSAFAAYNKFMRTHHKQQYEAGSIRLDVLPNALVTKIVFEDADGTSNIR